MPFEFVTIAYSATFASEIIKLAEIVVAIAFKPAAKVVGFIMT